VEADRQSEPTWIVRGGITTPDQLANGTRAHVAVPGLFGFSVQHDPGRTREDLAAAGRFPNAQISVTTAEQLIAAGRAVGYDVRIVRRPGRGFHHTVETPDPLPGDLAEALSGAFHQVPNPVRFRP